MGAHAPHGRLPAACVAASTPASSAGEDAQGTLGCLTSRPPRCFQFAPASPQPGRSAPIMGHDGPPWDPASRYDAYLFTKLCNGSSVDSAGRPPGRSPRQTSQPVGTTRNDLEAGALRVNSAPKKGGGAARPTDCIPVAGFDCLALEQEKAGHPIVSFGSNPIEVQSSPVDARRPIEQRSRRASKGSRWALPARRDPIESATSAISVGPFLALSWQVSALSTSFCLANFQTRSGKGPNRETLPGEDTVIGQ